MEESLREDTVEANFDVLNQLRDDLCQLIQLTEGLQELLIIFHSFN